MAHHDYVVSVRGTIPPDIVEKISQAHAKALVLCKEPEVRIDSEEELDGEKGLVPETPGRSA